MPRPEAPSPLDSHQRVDGLRVQSTVDLLDAVRNILPHPGSPHDPDSTPSLEYSPSRLPFETQRQIIGILNKEQPALTDGLLTRAFGITTISLRDICTMSPGKLSILVNNIEDAGGVPTV